MNHFWAVLWVIGAPLLAGLALVRLTPAARGFSAPTRWAIAYVLGATILGSLLFVALALGCPPFLQAALPLLIAAAAFAVPRGREPAHGPPTTRSEGVGVGIVLAVFALHGGLSWEEPIMRGDEARIWNLRAKMIHAGFGDEFRDRMVAAVPHRNYPLLNPLLQQFTFHVDGSLGKRLPRVPIQGYGLALAALVTSFVLRRAPRFGFLLLLPLFSTGQFWHGMRTAQADLMVGVGLVLLALGSLERGARGAFCRALGAAVAIASKSEGAAWVAWWLVAEIVSRVLNRRRSGSAELVSRPSIWWLFPLGWFVATLAFNRHFGFTSDLVKTDAVGRSPLERAIELGPERVRVFVDWFTDSWTTLSGALAFGPFILLLVLAMRRIALAPRLRVFTLALLGWQIILLAVYATTPHDLRWHLQTSFSRVTIQLVPVAVIWAAILLTSRQGEGARR